MNRTKNEKKRLAVLAAICSSVFLLAACEPGTEPMDTTGGDEGAPTYGEPERGTPPSEPEQPSMSPSEEQGPPESSTPPPEQPSEPGAGQGGEEPAPPPN